MLTIFLQNRKNYCNLRRTVFDIFIYWSDVLYFVGMSLLNKLDLLEI
jgi:hypothetical protein